MRLLLLTLILCHSLAAFSQSYSKLHYKATLVDTHNDVLSSQVLEGKDISRQTTVGHSDLDRWKQGGMNVQFFSVWTGVKARNPEGYFKDANEEIDSLEILILRNHQRMALATRYRQIKRGLRQGKLVSFIGVEGGHIIENDLQKLEALYNRGMRYLTLTWNNSNDWASSAMDETLHPENLKQKGLTPFGKQVIRRMNELGIIVDLSHTGEQTFYDAIAESDKPVLLSHSSVWNLCPVFRNVKDDQIRAVAKNGGVICINFFSGFIGKKFAEQSEWLDNHSRRIIDSLTTLHQDSTKARQEYRAFRRKKLETARPTLADMVDHIDYIVKIVGDDYVGLGSDYDGVGSLPIGLEDVSSYPHITKELHRRGYSRKSVKKILGKNVLRVMRRNFK